MSSKTKHINATKHARKRMQQRAISSDMVLLIETFGKYRYQKGGSHVASLDERRISELRRALDRLTGVQLVIGESEEVVTAMHRTRRTHTTHYVA